jgi:aspartyl-tRNA(Asn)/glutamyl-tRNA(Gln) amidotransferase subunit B
MTQAATAASAVGTEYEAVIGLEVHAQLLTRSKMFCSCSADYNDAPPNTHTCPVCLGLPGVLPVMNRQAVEWTILTALALNCEIPEYTKFDRKNYFYPDLPKGYQISQYDLPLSRNGHLDITVGGETVRAGITRVHLEEDTGTMHHAGDVLQSATSSVIDLNRCGVPLMEIVGEPDLRTPEQAREYLQRLRQMLVYLGVNDGNLEKGSFRCDANVSLRRRGDTEFGTKVEVKNMNSFRAVQKALEYELSRQAELLGAGERIVQETRGWVEAQGATISQRSKEVAADYKYFPEPDLPPLEISRLMVDRIRAELPELPDAKLARFVAQYGLSEYDASVITQTLTAADTFEALAAEVPAKLAANWFTGDVARLAKETGTELQDSGLGIAGLTALLRLVDAKTINGATAKVLLDELYAEGGNPAALVKERGLAQVSDASELGAVVDEVITANPKAVEDFRGGTEAALQSRGPVRRRRTRLRAGHARHRGARRHGPRGCLPGATARRRDPLRRRRHPR